MRSAIYTYELTRVLRQPATYLYFAVFFAIALLSMLGTGGFFDGVPESDEERRLLNSSHEINFIFQYFNKLFLFLLPAIVGMVIYKDFKHNVHPVLYTYPIRKSAYLSGKFLSSLTAVFLVTLSAGIAIFVGELVLGRGNPMIGPTHLWGYASAYLFFVLPNMFIYGLMVFVAVASLRNVYAGFIAVVLLFLLQIMLESLFAGDPLILALLDPFGQNTVAYETRFWTIAEQNVQQIPVWGAVLWNRILWASISLAIFGAFYAKFRLEQETFSLLPGALTKREAPQNTLPSQPPASYPRADAVIDFSVRQQLKALLRLSALDFRFIIRNWLFHVLLLFGVLALVFALRRFTNSGDMTFLPLTRIMLSVPMFFFSMVIVLLTFIYAGMLVHRARMARADQLIDTTATANWVLLGSKILALLRVQLFLLFVMMICGIGLQLYNGYFHVEIELYLFHLLLITFPTLAIWAAVSVLAHTLLPNVYLGIFLLLLLWIGKDQLHQVGLESYLLQFNSPPPLTYSDLNGFGNELLANHVINAFWLAFAGFLVVLAYLFWQRGFSFSARERIETAARRFRGVVPYVALVFLSCYFLLGLYIHQEENSPLKPVGNAPQALDDFRANFGKYSSAVQPKITSVRLNIDLFPEDNSFRANGNYSLVNSSSQAIDTLLIRTGYDEITTYSLDAPARLIQEDKGMKFAAYVLGKPLLPGDSLSLRFKIENQPNTLLYQNSPVLQNGTFLRADILPRLGYFWDKDPKEPTDSLAQHLNFYAPDADLVDIETIISTHHTQTAIAPGYLKNQWAEGGRNYFHYHTDEKIKFAFTFISGIFSNSHANHKGVGLEIFHHENHAANVPDMMEGLKSAIDYNTYYFGPYQHRGVRVVEFPLTEGSHASVMGNAIPTSEVRFVVKNEDVANRVNLSFYVQAHELTHQWWGNQIVPADALGAKMLTESITEYISLMIYERYFGPEKARHFLSLQRQRYLEGRARETGEENPLCRVRPEQEYIAYGKGAMALNALQYRVGEEKLNGILKAFLEKYKFRTDQYPTTVDLIAWLKTSLPPEFHYIIIDMMESVAFYDNKITQIRPLPTGKLEISFDVKKWDGKMKNELEAPNILLDIGQYDEQGRLLAIQPYSAASGENKIILSPKPNAKSIVLDPLLHFIELDVENNRKALRKE